MSVKIYSSSAYKRFFRRRTAGQKIIPSKIDVVDNATIVVQGRAGFGVYDADGRFVDSSRQIRGNNNQVVHSHIHIDAATPFIDETVVFFGNVYPQFGHFLLEHMNRAWGLLHDITNGARVVLVNEHNYDTVPEYMYALIEMMGVPRDRVIILTETTRFRRVIVPAQGFNIARWANDEFVRAYEHIAAGAPNTHKYEKIYMSRDALESRRTYGEHVVERIFENNGFKIIRPEKMSLAEQVGVMKHCRVLAGCAGTALHMALFMPCGGTVIQIKRNRRFKCNADTQNLINMVKKLNGVFISGSVERAATDHGGNAPQIIGVTKYMRQFFDENGFKYTDADTIPDPTEVAEYDTALAKFCAEHGSVRFNKFKHKLVRYLACFVPGRVNRNYFRHWMQRVLKIG